MKKSRTYLIGLILLLIMAITAPFFIPGPGGKPLMTIDRVLRIISSEFPIAQQADQLRRKARETAKEVSEKVENQLKSEKSETDVTPTEPPAATSPETLYKWRDKKGTWHFTNRPPPDGVNYKIVKWKGTANTAPEK